MFWRLFGRWFGGHIGKMSLNEETERKLFTALEASDEQELQRLCTDHPWLIKDYLWDRNDTWMKHAIRLGNIRVISLLLDLGFSADAMDRDAGKVTALQKALHKENDEVVELLLSRGADPNLGRPIVSALNQGSVERQLKYFKLLLGHGADVNKLFPLYGDEDDCFTALDWCDDSRVADFLRQNGAKTRDELNSDVPKTEETTTVSDAGPQVVAHFDAKYGSVD